MKARMIIILIFFIIVTTKPVLAYSDLEGDEVMAGHGGGAVTTEDGRGLGSPPGPSACTYIGGGNYNGGGGCHIG
ncbi:hypothetical protein ACSBR1_032710 [Camellia fascicularis]